MTTTVEDLLRDTEISAEVSYTETDLLSKGVLDAERLTGKEGRRVVPFLATLQASEGPKDQHLLTGSISVISEPGLVRLNVRISGKFKNDEVTGLTEVLEPEKDLADTAQLTDEVQKKAIRFFEEINFSSWKKPNDAASYLYEFTAAHIAKRFAEHSHNAVLTIRSLRYKLERQLIGETSGKQASKRSTKSVVRSLTLLGIFTAKARDGAQHLVREGLWIHLTNAAAYHAYRIHRDPSLVKDFDEESWLSEPLPMREKHDAAIRHCESMSSELSEESNSIRFLLSAASSVSAAEEADAQGRLNIYVAAASIALGLPAVVFSLYGANNFADLKRFSESGACFILSAIFITGFAARELYRSKPERSWWIVPTAVAIILIILQFFLFVGPYPPEEG